VTPEEDAILEEAQRVRRLVKYDGWKELDAGLAIAIEDWKGIALAKGAGEYEKGVVFGLTLAKGVPLAILAEADAITARLRAAEAADQIVTSADSSTSDDATTDEVVP
jgi:hypothetical protein